MRGVSEPDRDLALHVERQPLFGSAACSQALRSLVTAPRTHLFENEYTRVASRSISAGSVLTTALAGAPAIATPFPSGNALADQLRFVVLESLGRPVILTGPDEQVLRSAYAVLEDDR